MKIAMVSEHASPLATLGGVDAGGQNVHVAALARALGRAGHVVEVYTRRDDPALPDVVPFGVNVAVVHVEAGPAEPVPKDELFAYMPEFSERLERRWRHLRPDVTHSHFWMSGWATLRAAHALGLSVVHTYHALGVTKRRFQGTKDTSPDARTPVEQELALECDQIVATSSEEVFELLSMGCEQPRVSLVPCGVDLTRFSSVRGCAGERPSDRAARDFRVLVVSRLVERKGIGNVIAAMPAVPDARLSIAGGPDRAALDADPEAARLMHLAATTGVADRVEFLGRVAHADVPSLYAAADAVVCVPWYEPFGLVALEAMACGKPVVASAVGGLVDTVIDGVTGVHVPPREPEAVGAVLRHLSTHRELCTAYGAAGARRARDRYAWETIAHDTMRAYVAALTTSTRDRAKVG